MITAVSPVKMNRDDIPYDSVRHIVLTEVFKSKQRSGKKTNGHRTMDELLEEAPSSSSSSSQLGESSSSILDRGTMTDDGEPAVPRKISPRLYGDCTRSSSTSTSSAIPCGSSEVPEGKKKPLNYREKRLADIRSARMKKYRESAEIVEFKCEEIELKAEFGKFFEELMEDDTVPATVYYRVVESLDCFFRAKTWESNCPKLLCEFLSENILKTCQELNEEHETSSAPDDWKAREIQIQVLLTLHVFVVTHEREWLDEAINKMRMIFISVGAEKLKTFVEEPVTDIFLELTGDGLATIYDELCINLPADLHQYNANLFRITETDDNFVKRRNGAANRLEQMLIETSDNLGVGGVERSTRSNSNGAGPSTSSEGPIRRRSSKRKIDGGARDLPSPTRASRSSRSDYKQFFVEDTPDEKYYNRRGRKPREVEDVEEEEEADEDSDEDEEEEVFVSKKKRTITIKEEIDEEVKQTPVAKLRAGAASKSGKRCSRRLSEMVKLSEERSKIPKKARENLNRILEKAKTPLRSITRPARKSVLFGSTPSSSPAPMSGNKKSASSRASLMSRFAAASPDEELTVDTSEGHAHSSEAQSPSSSAMASQVTSPTVRERQRKKPVRFRRESASESRASRPVKQEVPDDDDYLEATPRTSTSSPTKRTPSKSGQSPKWTDRQLKRQLGLTREDLNRYRNAMILTGQGQGNRDRNVNNINWENAQVNRAGRVKGAGNSEDGTPIFGIARRNVRTMICHVLLNDTNPDTSFNWNKVKFDELDSKPRTRQFQSLKQKPEAFMESLKKKYMEKKALPLKRMRSNQAAAAAAAAAANAIAMSSADLISVTAVTTPKKKKTTTRKRGMVWSSSPPKKRIPVESMPLPMTLPSVPAPRARARSEDYDEWGFETEAED